MTFSQLYTPFIFCQKREFWVVAKQNTEKHHIFIYEIKFSLLSLEGLTYKS